MTKPVLEILPREERSEEEVVLMSKFSLLIDEFINFGTHVLKWEIETAKGGDENVPISMMFRHLLELGDSISLLVKNSSIDPCKLQLRGVLEALLGIEYILEENTQNRAMGFMTWHCHNRLKIYKKFDPNEQSHKELTKKIQADQLFEKDFMLPLHSEIDKHIKNLESLLSSPAYLSAEAEFHKYTNPSWYQLFGGPRTFEQLANHLKRQTFYEFLYRQWSGPTHGTDVFIGRLLASQDGKGNADIVQLRYVKDAQEVVEYTLSFLLLVFNLLIEKRVPLHKAELTDWFSTIQKPYLEITTQKDLITIK